MVTGAAQGLGQAFALRLATDGRDVVLADVGDTTQTARLVTDSTPTVRVVEVECNVADPGAVNLLAAQVDQDFGRCDILVNNAGIYPLQAFGDMSFEDWRRVQSVNIDAMFVRLRRVSVSVRCRPVGVQTKGVLQIIAMYPHSPPVNLHRVAMKELEIRGSFVYAGDHAAAIEMVRSGAVDLRHSLARGSLSRTWCKELLIWRPGKPPSRFSLTSRRRPLPVYPHEQLGHRALGETLEQEGTS